MAQPNDEEEDRNDGKFINSTGTLTSPLLEAPPLPTLPFDLIAEILCRLPVKLLLQLQCLCKYWKSLISNPKFAKKHLQSSIKRHHIVGTSTNKKKFVLYDSEISSTSIVAPTQISYPVTRQKNGYRKPYSLCSCDGIFCFAIDNRSAILWNPSIRKFKLLPPLEEKYCPRYSFGYDPFIRNYKTIVMSYCIDTGQNEVSVNTMGANYWRRIHDFPSPGFIHRPGVFLSGTVNWLAYDTKSIDSHVIVSLDLEKESYQKLSRPDLKDNGTWTLGVVRDCLCIFAVYDMFLDVWIMKEYGNKESWTKVYSFPSIGDRNFRYHTEALIISKDDQLLMNFYESESKKGKFFIYDLKNGTMNIHEIQNMNHLWCTKVYVESLISPY